MPMYDYKCSHCDITFTELHGSEVFLKDCPTCENATLKRQFPHGIQAKTDREYFRGKGSLSDQFVGREKELTIRVANAQRHGYRPTSSDVYEPSLAMFPGDPAGFISPAGGRSQVARRRDEMTAEGPIPKAVKLAPDIVESIRRDRITENPDLAHANQRELREEIVDKHGNPNIEE